MNLHDEEWVPEPTSAPLLRAVRSAVMEIRSAKDIARLRALLLRGEPAATENNATAVIPHEVRGTVWTLLLGMNPSELLREPADEFARRAKEAVSEENSKDQMWKDVTRTRPALARFKQKPIRAALLRLLSLFCLERKIAYIQGFNELLAPFILLSDTGENPRVVYALFSRFLERFAPFLLDTSEDRVFDTLKRAFGFFNRLLLYHDPKLYWLLDKNLMTPDIYATSWFMTMFARNFTIEAVLALWDLVLLDNNVLSVYFFGLALLISKREELFDCDPATLPERLMQISSQSPQEVRTLWRRGTSLREGSTPMSALDEMRRELYGPPGSAVDGSARSRDPKATGIQATCRSLSSTCQDLAKGFQRYFVWDCRTYEEYCTGHLAQAAFLKLDRLREASRTGLMSAEAEVELVNAIEFCADFEGAVHICLVGSGVSELDDQDVRPLIDQLTQSGIKRISILRDGFLGAVANPTESQYVEVADFSAEASRHSRQQRLAKQRSLGSGLANLGEVLADAKEEVSKALEVTVGRAEQEADSLSNSGSSTVSDESRRLKGAKGSSNSGRPLTRSADTKLEDQPSGVESLTPRLPDAPAELPSSRSKAGWSSIRHSMTSLRSSGSKGVSAVGQEPRRSLEAERVTTNVAERKPAKERRQGLKSPFGRSRASASDKTAGWGNKAKKGWLSDKSLSLSPKDVPSGFSVNIKDDKVMAGLTLFACELSIEERKGPVVSRGVSEANEAAMSRKYIGLSNHYFIVLRPHPKKKDHCQVELMRLVEDVVRISFRKSRPENVTFELAPRISNPRNSAFLDELEEELRHLIYCRMEEGLQECVGLIKEYLRAKGL